MSNRARVWFIIYVIFLGALSGFLLGRLIYDRPVATAPEPTSAITSSTHVLRDGTEVQCLTWYSDASDETTAERECFITGTQLPTLPAD